MAAIEQNTINVAGLNIAIKSKRIAKCVKELSTFDEVTKFLDDLDINKISPIQLSPMEKPVSLEEIKLAILQRKGSTSLILAKFTIEFYITFVQELSPKQESV